MAAVSVACEQTRFQPLAAGVRRVLAGALRKLKIPRASLEVLLVSDGAMARVNRRARGKRGPTNVLSFPALPARGGAAMPFPRPDLPPRTRHLGEIYLAPAYIARHGEHLEPLALHGLLHLLGYTHRGKRDTMEMERLEAALRGRRPAA